MPKIVRRKSAAVAAPELVTHSIFAGVEPAGTVAIPVRDHMNTSTVKSLIYAALVLPTAVPKEAVLDFSIIQGSVLTLQRNEAVQRMRGDWLLFIDDDMVFEPNDILQLIVDQQENDLDMVGGLCFRRTAPFQPTLYMRESPTDGRYNFLESWDTDLVEVDATGMAFVLIHRRVFEKIAVMNGEHFPGYEERMAGDPPEYFVWINRIGEDLRFCQLAKEAGCRIFVDTRVKVGHIGEQNITHDTFLAQLAMRGPDLLERRRAINTEMGLPTVEPDTAKEALGWK